MDFETAKRKYTNRFTCEHVPSWANKICVGSGVYYAPQFSTDLEWYENTKFPPHYDCYKTDCYTTGQTFPLGNWLENPYKK